MADGIILPARLKELFCYDPDTGIFTRRISTNTHNKAGEVAGCRQSTGYINIGADKRFYKAHRLAWLYVYGDWPDGFIDHINGVRDDNRIANLRIATNAENAQNQRKPRTNNKSGFLGVHFQPKKKLYAACIMIDGKSRTIGRFKKAEDAHQAYLEAKRKYHAGCTI